MIGEREGVIMSSRRCDQGRLLELGLEICRKSSLGRGENVERHKGERVGDVCGKYLYYTL